MAQPVYYVNPGKPMYNPEMAEDLARFVELMVEKLNNNSHKDAVGLPDVPRLVELLQREMGEFIRQYMEDKNDPNAARELADMANFAFLIYKVLKS